MPARVVLIGLDGFPARAIRPNLTPHLCHLATEGGGMAPNGGRAALPSTTYPGFASLLTGCLPARHAVRSTAQRAGAMPGWAGSNRVRVPTLFDACRAAGVGSAAIQGDHLLHTVLRTEAADRRWPPEGDVVPAGTPVDAHGYPTNGAVRSEVLAAAADPTFGFVFLHLNEADTLGHDLGPDDPETLACYRATDGLVREIRAACSSRWADTIVIVVSDHDMDARSGEPAIDLWSQRGAQDLIEDVLGDGGAALIRPRGGSSEAALRALLLATPGVVAVEDAGETVLAASAAPGRHFRYPHGKDAPAGGLHGGVSTLATVAVVGGGNPAARALGNAIELVPPRLVDWAATIAGLLGIDLGVVDGRGLGPVDGRGLGAVDGRNLLDRA